MRAQRCTGRAIVGVAVLLLVGCGVPEDNVDRPVGQSEVQFGLLDPVPTTTSTSTTTTRVPPSSTMMPTTTLPSFWMDLYLVQNQRLVRVRRPTGIEPTVNAVLDALTRPNVDETFGGRRSELTDPGLLVSVFAERGTANVELGEGFSALLGSEQLLAIGQIVYSLTEVGGIGNVAFSLAGNPLEVPGVDGGLISGPIAREDLQPDPVDEIAENVEDDQ